MTTSVKDNLLLATRGLRLTPWKRQRFPPWNVWLHVEWWPYCRPQKSSL